MLDPPTTIAAIGTGAIVTTAMLKRLLGPTADYLGERVRDFVQKADENLQVVTLVALDKLREEANRPGEVNARVFKTVWDEGRFVEDAFVAEYFGGLLASARTEDGRDDSALPFVSLVKSLSTYQLRLHFIIYRLVAQFRGKSERAKSDRMLVRFRVECSGWLGQRPSNRRHFWGVAPATPRYIDSKYALAGLHLEIPGDDLHRAFDVQEDFEAHLLLALNGLVDLRLIEPSYSLRFGALRKGPYDDESEGDFLIISPNDRGASLFLRALGGRGLSPELITTIDVDYGLSSNIVESLRVPEHFRFFYASPNDELRALSDAIDSIRSDLEDVSGKYDDLESDVESLSDKIDDGGNSEVGVEND